MEKWKTCFFHLLLALTNSTVELRQNNETFKGFYTTRTNSSEYTPKKITGNFTNSRENSTFWKVNFKYRITTCPFHFSFETAFLHNFDCYDCSPCFIKLLFFFSSHFKWLEYITLCTELRCIILQLFELNFFSLIAKSFQTNIST